MNRQQVLFVAILLLSQALSAAQPRAYEAQPRVYEARLVQITRTDVTIEGLGTYPLDPAVLECFDFRKERTTCETLAGVGYADRARITFVSGKVRRIDILELQQ
jgi:hypothetical protein